MSAEVKKEAVVATSLQPPIYDTISMAPGVTMTEGSRTKAGSERTVDPKHMKLATYKEMFQERKPRNVDSDNKMEQSISDRKEKSKDKEEDKQSIKSGLTSQKSLKGTMDIKIKMDLLRDIDDPGLKLPEIVEEKSASKVKPKKKIFKTRSPEKINVFLGGGNIKEEEMSEVDRFNLQLMGDTAWGQADVTGSRVVIPQRGVKPTQKEIKAGLGNIKKAPRERNNVEKSTTKKRLPPPPLGSTMGHGNRVKGEHQQDASLGSLQSGISMDKDNDSFVSNQDRDGMMSKHKE